MAPHFHSHNQIYNKKEDFCYLAQGCWYMGLSVLKKQVILW
jgi:hypothetical protein